MEKKQATNKKINEPNPLVKKNKVLKNYGDDAYIQINQIAFQQNFQALIGHFKKDLNYKSQSLR